MKQLDLGKTGFFVPEIALGCMRMADLSIDTAAEVLQTAMEVGVNFFDHANIYGGGLSEEMFAKAARKLGVARQDMILQTKCGIRRADETQHITTYDFSKDHIIASVEGSLKRLQTDYIDLLALHRPDTLMEPEEVAEALDALYKSGKVRYFGVSNQNQEQMKLLEAYTDHKFVTNQLQFGLVHTGMVDIGFHVNMKTPQSVDHDGGILEYSRRKGVTIQAWSPYRAEVVGPVFIDNPDYPAVNAKLAEYAEQHGVTKDTIATAWILRHPAKMQVITGSMNPERIRQIAKAAEVCLSRTEWYDLYLSAGNMLP
ncbi:MAG: aldo/keto reductase [Oscillospiraceae bacterium]|nr:aldo/keto reductase [Oscillospiraceae bacterium]